MGLQYCIRGGGQDGVGLTQCHLYAFKPRSMRACADSSRAQARLPYFLITAVLMFIQGAEGISTSEMLYYNAVTSLPILVAIVAATGEGGMVAARWVINNEKGEQAGGVF